MATILPPKTVDPLFVNLPGGGLAAVPSVPPANNNPSAASGILGGLSSGAAASPLNKTPWGAILAGIGILGQGFANRNVLNAQQNQEIWGLDQTKKYQAAINNALTGLVGKIKTTTPAAATAKAKADYTSALNGALGPEYGNTGAAYGKAYGNAAAQSRLDMASRSATLANLLSKVAGPNMMRRTEGYDMARTGSTVDMNNAFARALAAANQGVVTGIHENPMTQTILQALQYI